MDCLGTPQFGLNFTRVMRTSVATASTGDKMTRFTLVEGDIFGEKGTARLANCRLSSGSKATFPRLLIIASTTIRGVKSIFCADPSREEPTTTKALIGNNGGVFLEAANLCSWSRNGP